MLFRERNVWLPKRDGLSNRFKKIGSPSFFICYQPRRSVTNARRKVSVSAPSVGFGSAVRRALLASFWSGLKYRRTGIITLYALRGSGEMKQVARGSREPDLLNLSTPAPWSHDPGSAHGGCCASRSRPDSRAWRNPASRVLVLGTIRQRRRSIGLD